MRSIIFDMDGVLIDSMPMHLQIWKKMFEERNIEFSEKIYEKYNGTSTPEIINALIQDYNLDDTLENMFAEKLKCEDEFKNSMLSIFNGVYEVLNQLKAKGIKLALATSARKSMLDFIDSKFNITSYFDEIVFGDMVEHTKPDPAIFLLAAEKLNDDPANCIVVEDAVNGILAAKRAGMIGVAITNTFPEESFSDCGTDYTISNLNELFSLIEK